MAKKTPQEAAEKWQRNLAGAGESIRSGVESVTESPTRKAARAVDRQVAGVQAAAASGKTAAALNAVSLDDWKASMLTKGLPRVAAGAQNAMPRVENFLSELLPFQDAAVQEIDAKMPRGDFEQNVNRAVAMMRKMKEFKRRR